MLPSLVTVFACPLWLCFCVPKFPAFCLVLQFPDLCPPLTPILPDVLELSALTLYKLPCLHPLSLFLPDTVYVFSICMCYYSGICQLSRNYWVFAFLCHLHILTDTLLHAFSARLHSPFPFVPLSHAQFVSLIKFFFFFFFLLASLIKILTCLHAYNCLSFIL